MSNCSGLPPAHPQGCLCDQQHPGAHCPVTWAARDSGCPANRSWVRMELLTALPSSLADHLQREAPGESQERREPPAGSGGAGPGRGVSRLGKHSPISFSSPPRFPYTPGTITLPPDTAHCAPSLLVDGSPRPHLLRGAQPLLVAFLQNHEVVWNLLPGVLSIAFIGEHVVEVLGRWCFCGGGSAPPSTAALILGGAAPPGLSHLSCAFCELRGGTG